MGFGTRIAASTKRRDTGQMLIRIDGVDLPGRTCPPGPDFPDGHPDVHVAVQGRRGQQDLVGLTPADAPTARWELSATVVSNAPFDLRGPQIHGSATHRFVYLSWGVLDTTGAFTMFRRAKLWLDAVPDDVLAGALDRELLIGTLGLTDEAGWPLCASVRPPRITWSTAK